MHQKPNMTTQLILMMVLLGLAAGLASGLVGIGGGIVLVPMLVFALGYSQLQAQGTSLGVLTLPVVALAFWQYYRQLRDSTTPIDTRVIGLLAVGFVIGGYLGSNLALRTDKDLLRKIFGFTMLYVAVKMLNWDQVIFRLIKKIF